MGGKSQSILGSFGARKASKLASFCLLLSTFLLLIARNADNIPYVTYLAIRLFAAVENFPWPSETHTQQCPPPREQLRNNNMMPISQLNSCLATPHARPAVALPRSKLSPCLLVRPFPPSSSLAAVMGGFTDSESHPDLDLGQACPVDGASHGEDHGMVWALRVEP